MYVGTVSLVVRGIRGRRFTAQLYSKVETWVGVNCELYAFSYNFHHRQPKNVITSGSMKGIKDKAHIVLPTLVHFKVSYATWLVKQIN